MSSFLSSAWLHTYHHTHTGATDVAFSYTRIRVLPSILLMPVTFTLRVDAVAQEFNETLSIIFPNIPLFNTGLFPRTPEALLDTLNITIIDQDGESLSKEHVPFTYSIGFVCSD